MRAPRSLTAVLIAAVLVAASSIAAGCSKADGPEHMVDRFLAGWPAGPWEDVSFLKLGGAAATVQDIATELATAEGDLHEAPAPVLTRTDFSTGNRRATVQVQVQRPLPGTAETWEYQTTVNLAQDDKGWHIVWEPSVVHPELTNEQTLSVRRIAPTRAAVVAGDGTELVQPRRVVMVGIHPARADDPAQLVPQVAAIVKKTGTDIDAEALSARVADPANADQFVDVITLRWEVYEPVRDDLQSLSGVIFKDEEWMLAPTRDFARALLGTVGPVTKEIMDANPDAYQLNDHAGLSGLQRQYDERLRGVPGIDVFSSRTAADGTIQETVLHTVAEQPGRPLRITLDPAMQQAAEEALGKVSQRSALVAIRISDGAVVAAANSGPVNLAFTAAVPPGSTFKTVSALGLLDTGKVTADQIVPCPKEHTVQGRTFRNAGGFVLGDVPFRTDFARSCNTAFAALAPELGSTGLAEAGKLVGLGEPWDVGTEAFSGKVSSGGDAVERAAAAFGQGTTIVSPVAMAGVAAAVARGQWLQPQLVLEPAPAQPAPAGPALAASTAEPLRDMMRRVVTEGTATALGDIPGAQIHGKTGTAEYDNDPDHAHAWFIGWQGDLAFAVFVEEGNSPSQTALPVTAAFLRSLPH